MIKIMSVKKLCALALVCLCVMFASPALAAIPVGPQIKGLQLGMHMTPSEMLDLAFELFRGIDFEMEVLITDEENLSEDAWNSGSYTFNFTWAGEQLKSWDIEDRDASEEKIIGRLNIGRLKEILKEKFAEFNFDDVFSFLEIEHILKIAAMSGSDGRSSHYTYRASALTLTPSGFKKSRVMEITNDVREGTNIADITYLKYFSLPSFVFFDVKNMSIDDFAQAIQDAYKLPGLKFSDSKWKGGKGDGKDSWDSWNVFIEPEDERNKGFKYSVTLTRNGYYPLQYAE